MDDFMDIAAPLSFILAVGVAIAIAVTVPMNIYLNHQTEQRKAFIAAGYTQATIPGAASVVWVKEAK